MITGGKSAILADTTTISISICPAAPGSGFRKASTGSVPRAVASGAFANGRSLPLAVLTRRLNPDLCAGGHSDLLASAPSKCGAFRDAPALQQVGYCGTRPTPKLVKSHTFNVITPAPYLQFIGKRFWGKSPGSRPCGASRSAATGTLGCSLIVTSMRALDGSLWA